tara:strand:- start:97 stop:1245 length:1149 start_codon:yes stop_codon:yes gene_type:complete
MLKILLLILLEFTEASEDVYGKLIISIEGTSLSKDEKQILTHPLVAGTLLLRKNIHDPNQLHQLVNEMRHIKKDILIFVDNEGYDEFSRTGIWRMLDPTSKKPIEGFSPPPTQYSIGQKYLINQAHGMQIAYEAGYTLSKQLEPFGIIPLGTCSDSNPHNFAPNTHNDNHQGEVIWRYGRSFGDDPSMIRDLIHSKLNGIQGVKVLKHFPDHGYAVDSHVSEAIDDRQLKDVMKFINNTILPNVSLVDLMMLSHVIFPNSPDRNTPVSLSVWWHGLLQSILKKDALIISDDLAMGAMKQTSYSQSEVISMCSNPYAFAKKHHITFNSFQNRTDTVTHLLILSSSIGTLKKLLPELNDRVSYLTKIKISKLSDMVNDKKKSPH